MKKFKKYEISYFFAVFFTAAFLLSFKYFDKESASMFIIFAVIACGAGIINFKLNR